MLIDDPLRPNVSVTVVWGFFTLTKLGYLLLGDELGRKLRCDKGHFKEILPKINEFHF